MLIQIKGETELYHIQDIFSGFYPYLKMEFYRLPHGKYEAVAEDNLVCPFQRLADLGLAKVSGLLQINPNHIVAEIEHEFQERLSLTIKVWRRAGAGWLKALTEDRLSLKAFNELGRQLNSAPGNVTGIEERKMEGQLKAAAFKQPYNSVMQV